MAASSLLPHARPNRIVLAENPLHEMARFVARRFPTGPVKIVIRSSVAGSWRRKGCAHVFNTGTLIELNARYSYWKLMEVEAHELAHAIIWNTLRFRSSGHGPQFRRIFFSILDAWEQRVEKLEEEA